jgi:hypothetical protein
VILYVKVGFINEYDAVLPILTEVTTKADVETAINVLVLQQHLLSLILQKHSSRKEQESVVSFWVNRFKNHRNQQVDDCFTLSSLKSHQNTFGCVNLVSKLCSHVHLVFGGHKPSFIDSVLLESCEK